MLPWDADYGFYQPKGKPFDWFEPDSSDDDEEWGMFDDDSDGEEEDGRFQVRLVTSDQTH